MKTAEINPSQRAMEFILRELFRFGRAIRHDIVKSSEFRRDVVLDLCKMGVIISVSDPWDQNEKMWIPVCRFTELGYFPAHQELECIQEDYVPNSKYMYGPQWSMIVKK